MTERNEMTVAIEEDGWEDTKWDSPQDFLEDLYEFVPPGKKNKVQSQ